MSFCFCLVFFSFFFFCSENGSGREPNAHAHRKEGENDDEIIHKNEQFDAAFGDFLIVIDRYKRIEESCKMATITGQAARFSNAIDFFLSLYD